VALLTHVRYPTTHHRLVGVVFPLTVLRMTVVSLCMHQKSLIECLQQEHSVPEPVLVSVVLQRSVADQPTRNTAMSCVVDAQNPAESWRGCAAELACPRVDAGLLAVKAAVEPKKVVMAAIFALSCKGLRIEQKFFSNAVIAYCRCA